MRKFGCVSCGKLEVRCNPGFALAEAVCLGPAKCGAVLQINGVAVKAEKNMESPNCRHDATTREHDWFFLPDGSQEVDDISSRFLQSLGYIIDLLSCSAFFLLNLFVLLRSRTNSHDR